MKKILITITLFLMLGSLSAQDKIYFNDGSTIEAKVLVVSESKIEYKNFDNQSGPTFEIGLSKINMIIYENGSHQIFKKEGDKDSMSKTIRDFRKNRINLDLFGSFTITGASGPTSISYETINKDGSKGLEIPISIYYNSSGVVGYAIGANLKFYLNKQGKGLYIGPSMDIGSFKWFGNGGRVLYDNSKYDSRNDLSIYLGPKLGYQYQISDLFGLNIDGNLGGISDFKEFDYLFYLNFGLNFSF
jgi:hypothetical protein